MSQQDAFDRPFTPKPSGPALYWKDAEYVERSEADYEVAFLLLPKAAQERVLSALPEGRLKTRLSAL